MKLDREPRLMTYSFRRHRTCWHITLEVAGVLSMYAFVALGVNHGWSFIAYALGGSRWLVAHREKYSTSSGCVQYTKQP